MNPTCPNLSCSKYGKRLRSQVILFGVQKNGTPRYKCKTCDKTFSKNKHSAFFYKHMTREELVKVCRMLAQKMSFRSISRKMKRHPDTIRGLASRISSRYHVFKDYFTKDLKLSEKEAKSMFEAVKKRKRAPVKNL